MSEGVRDIFGLFHKDDFHDEEHTTTALLAIINTVLHEGGYVWDEHDAGGETNFGISKRAHPEVDIKKLSIRDACEIYYNEYWKPSGAHRLKSPVLACIFFDMCVNAGVTRATKLLQEVCGETQDGILGELTAKACNEHESIVYEYTRRREQFYFNIASDGKNKRFLNGWLRRCHDFDNMLEAQWRLRDILDYHLLYSKEDPLDESEEDDMRVLRCSSIVQRVLLPARIAIKNKQIDTGVVAHIG